MHILYILKLKLPKLFKWNIKVSFVIDLDNIIQLIIVPTELLYNFIVVSDNFM